MVIFHFSFIVLSLQTFSDMLIYLCCRASWEREALMVHLALQAQRFVFTVLP